MLHFGSSQSWRTRDRFRCTSLAHASEDTSPRVHGAPGQENLNMYARFTGEIVDFHFWDHDLSL